MSWLWMTLIAFWVLAFCAGGWITHAILMMYTVRVLPRLENSSGEQLETWPKVSVIIPACNEAETLEDALQTLIAEDYPALEIVLINDRSTDGTDEIVERMASQDERITPVHIKELPDGWLGKVNAMHQGVEMSSGEWILLTDADVHFTKGCLRRAIGYAHDHQRDFITVLPDVLSKGFWLHTTLLALGELMAVGAKIWEIGKDDSKAYAGIGPFNLIRRDFWDQTEGFAWLKMEVSEDLGVGLLMQRSGAKMAMLNGRNVLPWTWYGSLGEMVRGLEKNIFSLSGFSYLKTFTMAFLLVVTVLAPFAAFLPHGMPWLRWVGALALFMHIPYAFMYSRWLNLSPLAGLCLPLGKIVVAFIMCNSAWQFSRRKGVIWRGTHYSIEQLRAGHRVEQQK